MGLFYTAISINDCNRVAKRQGKYFHQGIFREFWMLLLDYAKLAFVREFCQHFYFTH